MTTAHRPTFDPARGGTGRGEGDLSKLSTQYSARDLPSNLNLKYRDRGQAHPDEVREKNLRYELEEKEREYRDRKRTSDISGAIEDGLTAKKSRFEPVSTQNLDADDPEDSDQDSDDDDDDDDDSDTELALKAELEKIKKERAEEKARKEEAAREEQERIRTEVMIRSNPLLNPNQEQNDFKVKRRWDDDVPFKNCAQGISQHKKETTFINDSIRSEFHRKFMDRYIK